MKRIEAVALSLLLFTCATLSALAKTPTLEPPVPSRGAIGVKVKLIPHSQMGYFNADAVYFVRVVDDSDRFASDSLIPSTYSKGTNVYLLNARPGRYVAVACTCQGVKGMSGPSTVVF